MAIRAINPKKELKTEVRKQRAKDSGMKPLAKHYLDENPGEEGKSFFVFQARVTPKGFLLLICKEFSLLCPAGMEEPTILLDNIFPKLHGKKANRLCIVLDKTNRFGGYVATDDEHQCYYSYDEVEEVLLTSSEPIINKEEKEKKLLSLEDFGICT